MLIALILGWLFLGHGHKGDLWFFGSTTPKQLREDVARVVPDKELQNTTNYNLDMIEKESENLSSQRSTLEKEVFASLERHDTQSEQIHALEIRGDQINATATRQMLDMRFVMRAQLSATQWQGLFAQDETTHSK